MLQNLLIELQFLFSSIVILALALGVGGVFLWFPKFGVQTLSTGVVGVLGFLVVGTAATVTHFFCKLDALFFYLICIMAMVGWVKLKDKFSQTTFMREVCLYLWLLILYWIVGLRAGPQSDFYVYHLPIISWMHDYPIALGLANVDGRYGTWNFWFPVCAGFSAGNILPFGLYAVNIALVAFALHDWIRIFRQSPRSAQGCFILALFIVFGCLETRSFGGGQKSPFVEFVGYIFICWSFVYFLARDQAENWKPLLLLMGTGVVTKLSQLPLAMMGAWILVLAIRKKKIASLIPLSVVVALGGLAMLIRSFLLTGCLVHPAKKTCFPVSWRVSDSELDGMVAIIKRWGRAPDLPADMVLNTWNWVPLWFERTNHEKIILTLYLVLGLYFLAKIIFRKKLAWPDLSALSVALVSLLYWFLSAPTLRFGYGYIASLDCLLMAPLLARAWSTAVGRFSEIKIVTSVLAVLIVLMTVYCTSQIRRANDFGVRTLVYEDTKYTVRKNAQGQPFIIPDNEFNHCGTLPFPCAFDHSFDPKIVQVQRGRWISFEK